MNKYTFIKRCIYLIVLIPSLCAAQVADDFSDGNFTHSPVWTGDTHHFMVNNYFQLQLNDDESGETSMFTDLPLLDEMEWRVWIRLAFSPSGNNHARFYLSALPDDTADMPDGLFIQLGEAGSDDAIRLMIQDAGDTSTLIRGTAAAIASSFKCRVKVLLKNDSCHLFVDYTGGFDFQPEGSCTWYQEPDTRYLGVFCKYTSSNSKKFYFDDFYAGPELYDTIQPEVKRYDVVINEIMADPSPPQQLPEHEYLELYNTTTVNLNLDQWVLMIGGSEKLLTGAKIDPEGYLILGKDDHAAEFTAYGSFYGLESFSLTNAGQEILLIDHKGEMISGIYYRDEWYDDDEKADGGWSLEQINPYNPCLGHNNWTASMNNKGGSPGTKNAVFEDYYLAPEIVRACAIDSVRIRIDFNQSLHSTITMMPEKFTIDHGAGPFVAILPDDPYFTSFILYPENPLYPGAIYRLTCISDITNCVGDTVYISTSIDLGLPEKIKTGDLVINEVLFDPFQGGSDYVEVYNRSDKAISLTGISLGSVKQSPPGPPDTSFSCLKEECMVLLPGEYALLCADYAGVDRFYYCSETKNYLEADNFPSFNNDLGRILLIDEAGLIIDAFSYQADMHYPLLNSNEGVSLERLHPDRPAYDPTNWHSASQISGFGTPGYRNSQYTEMINTDEAITISPAVCSPGYDSHNNHIGIQYEFEKAGYLANIMIFNTAGQLCRQLVNNEMLGTKGAYTWNGIDDNHAKVPAGMYIILLELTDIEGKIVRYKKVAAVAPGRR